MLPTSQAFLGAIQDETMEVIPRIRWWFSWNHLLEPTVVANTDSIDPELFPPESILNEQHQLTSGSSYAIVGESYTSNDPRYGYRLAPKDSEINPMFISKAKGSETNRVDVIYPRMVDANVLEVQIENLHRSTGTFHRPNVTVSTYDGSTWGNSSTISVTNEGHIELYWNGIAWRESADPTYTSSTRIQGVQIVIQGMTTGWNPRVRYVGAHNVIDVTDDIIDFSVTKSEGEQLTYMPFSDPVSNTASLTLDNTAQEYALAPVGAEQPIYDLNMRFDFELGIDTSNHGGSGVEYLPLGTFYLDNLGYTTDLDLNIGMTDRTKFLQRKFLDDCFYENKSLKFIVEDLFARTGFDAGNIDFQFGVPQVARGTAKLPYAWYKADTLLWDACANMVKSELGSFFVQEDNSYVFTDREFLNMKLDEGVKWTIDADIDLEHAAQEFTVDANEVEVAYTKPGKNIDEHGLTQPSYVYNDNGELELTYTSTGPIELSAPLWEPGEALVLNAATLHANMTPAQDFVQLTRPAGDTFPQEGTINIEGEFMDYEDKIIETDYVELIGVTRGVRNSMATAHNNGATQIANVAAQQFTYYPYDPVDAPAVTTALEDGKFSVKQSCPTNSANTFTAFRPFGSFTNPSGQDYAYGCRFTFRETDHPHENNMAGMFVHSKPSTWAGDKNIFDAYWIEIVSMTEIARTDYITGSLRVFRTSDKNPMTSRSGLPPTLDHAIYGHDGVLLDKNMPVNIDVYWDASIQMFSLYLNDVFMTSWQASYTDAEIIHPDAQNSAHKNNYYDPNPVGHFGIYVRGNTKADFEYVYGGDIKRGHDNYIADYLYGGFVSDEYMKRQEAEHFLEFGAIAHELRHFDVEHQVYPNRWVRVFHSNVLEARVMNERHTSFHSSFDVLNTSRSPAVLVGNDHSRYNSGLGADHEFLIYGATVIELESGEKVARDKHAIRKRGISNVRVESPWIQSDGQAKRISEWVSKNWAEPVDFYEVEWFPMWALQPGDRVDINYPEKGF